MIRRLVSAEDVDAHQATLRDACQAAVTAMSRKLSGRLAAHGLTLASDRTKAPASLWNDDEWAAVVIEHVEPAARQIAGDVIAQASAHFEPAVLAGMPDQTEAYTSTIVQRALNAGPSLGAIVTGRPLALVAAAGGNIVAIRDALDSAAVEMDRLVSRSASHVANAATGDVGAAIEANTGESLQQVWYCSFVPASRADHEDADGQQVPIGEPFDIGGELLMYPGDPDGSDEQTANCLCVAGDTIVDWSDAVAVLRRPYEGELITVVLASGNELSATPNHPILTPAGWQPIGMLNEGDDIVCGSLRDQAAVACPHEDHVPTKIEQLFGAAALAGMLQRMRVAPMDFYGDGSDGEVEVAILDHDLLPHVQSALGEHAQQFGLAAAHRQVRRTSDRSSLFRRGLRLAHRLRRRSTTYRDASRSQYTAHDVAVHRETAGDTELRFASLVGDDDRVLVDGTPARFADDLVGTLMTHRIEQSTFTQNRTPGVVRAMSGGAGMPSTKTADVQLDRVLYTSSSAFNGWVYDLTTRVGWFAAHGIILHNCWVEGVGFGDWHDVVPTRDGAGGNADAIYDAVADAAAQLD